MLNGVNNQSFWDNIYKNRNVGWDLKSSTPAFKSFLKEQNFPTSSKILILVSGYGYDAIEAAKMGLEVTAVDFSQIATNTAIKNADKQKIKINFLIKDFFTLRQDYNSYFNLVYDYVSYCAIDPSRRKEYAKLIGDLLKCNGTYIALWFPVEKRKDGPPYGIDLDETQKIFSGFLKLQMTLIHKDTINPRKGREVLQTYQKQC